MDERKIKVPKNVVLFRGKTVLFPVQGASEVLKETRSFDFAYRVNNLLVAPKKPLQITIPLEVVFTPSKKQ